MNFKIECQEDHEPMLIISKPIGSVRTILEEYPTAKDPNQDEERWRFILTEQMIEECIILLPAFIRDTCLFTNKLKRFLAENI